MSLEVDWERLTGGPDGEVLAETIRAFIHDRFQKVTLPKMIRSVKVHSFGFGSVPPEIQLKDVCDPLPEFYEDEDDDKEESPRASRIPEHAAATTPPHDEVPERPPKPQRANSVPVQLDSHQPRPTPLDTSRLGISRTSTPGIPGGTSNISYFHLPLSARLSGTATPFAAFGGPHGWLDGMHHGPWPSADLPRHRPLQSFDASNGGLKSIEEGSHAPKTPQEKVSEDMQIVTHVRYSGDARLTLTADILLDYPMPSFVGIPLQLRVVGLTFDGVAILAYIKKKAHFCFLSPEDAEASLGTEPVSPGTDRVNGDAESDSRPIGRLFEEIRVESEIGQRTSGKQVLKNVGKVEKFVLEQVRRIFENEFVFPSFWTFLV